MHHFIFPTADTWVSSGSNTTTGESFRDQNFGRDQILEVKKEFYNKDSMNELKISEGETSVIDRKNTFMQSVISTLKRKINDPLGVRKKKREKGTK